MSKYEYTQFLVIIASSNTTTRGIYTQKILNNVIIVVHYRLKEPLTGVVCELYLSSIGR